VTVYIHQVIAQDPMEPIDAAVALLPGAEDDGCCQLTYSERLIGFGISALCGTLAGFLAIISLFILNLRKFSVLFTVSTLLFIVSLGLLIGFKKLLSSFGARNRIVSGLGLFGGMSITLFFGLFKRMILLSILGFTMEILSFLYFALSFIPGGERLFHLLLF
jgi:hypothetical protein